MIVCIHCSRRNSTDEFSHDGTDIVIHTSNDNDKNIIELNDNDSNIIELNDTTKVIPRIFKGITLT